MRSGFTWSWGRTRSLAKTAEKVGKSKVMMEKLSRKFDWPARVKAHAAHVAEMERLAIEAVAREKAVEWDKVQEAVRREAWREAEETIAMVRKARQEWLEKGRLPGWEGMARMLELAFKLKQFATGMPSEVKEVHTNVTGTVEVEWEIALRKAYGPKADEGDRCGGSRAESESGEGRRADRLGPGKRLGKKKWPTGRQLPTDANN